MWCSTLSRRWETLPLFITTPTAPVGSFWLKLFVRPKKPGCGPRGSTDEARSGPGSDSGNATGPGTHWHTCLWANSGNTASEAGWSWIGLKLRSSKTCRSSESFCLFVFLVCSAQHFPFLVFHSERLCLRALSRGKASLESEKGWQEKVGQILRHTHIRSLARPRQGPVLLCESVTSIAVFDTALCQWERAYESPVSCLIRETGCFPYWVKLSAKGLVLHLENTPLLQIRPQTVQTHPGASAIQT